MDYIGKHVSSQTWDFYRLYIYLSAHYLLHQTKTHLHVPKINTVVIETYALYRLEWCEDSWHLQFFQCLICELNNHIKVPTLTLKVIESQ